MLGSLIIYARLRLLFIPSGLWLIYHCQYSIIYHQTVTQSLSDFHVIYFCGIIIAEKLYARISLVF